MLRRRPFDFGATLLLFLAAGELVSAQTADFPAIPADPVEVIARVRASYDAAIAVTTHGKAKAKFRAIPHGQNVAYAGELDVEWAEGRSRYEGTFGRDDPPRTRIIATYNEVESAEYRESADEKHLMIYSPPHSQGVFRQGTPDTGWYETGIEYGVDVRDALRVVARDLGTKCEMTVDGSLVRFQWKPNPKFGSESLTFDMAKGGMLVENDDMAHPIAPRKHVADWKIVDGVYVPTHLHSTRYDAKTKKVLSEVEVTISEVDLTYVPGPERCRLILEELPPGTFGSRWFTADGKRWVETLGDKFPTPPGFPRIREVPPPPKRPVPLKPAAPK